MKSLPSSAPFLLGDIGGTNARFAWMAGPGAEIQHIRTLPCADFPSLGDAARAYLDESGLSRPRCGALGIASPVLGDWVQMTNHHWSFSVRELQAALGLERLRVLNDFTAMALSLPALTRESLVQVGGRTDATLPQVAPIGLLGPGTGLGVSGLIPMPGKSAQASVHWHPISGEGGHVTLAASNDLESAVIARIRQRYGHVSAERVLSGQGLVDLHLALGEVEGGAGADVVGAADISTQALQGGDARALRTLDLFAGFLGSTAADLALTLGAHGGIYIGGGIVPRWLGWFETSSFRARFEAKGRYRDYLQPIPAYVINASFPPALLGAAQALLEPLG